jgi:sulfur transfer complex TusBCD TusB component (DsrH family)
MNLVELKNILEESGLPVTYYQWKTTPTNPIPSLPYLCYLVENSPNFMADNKVYHKINDVNIELYSIKKDLISENKLETILDENDIPYETSEVFIKSENLYKKTYEVSLL